MKQHQIKDAAHEARQIAHLHLPTEVLDVGLHCRRPHVELGGNLFSAKAFELEPSDLGLAVGQAESFRDMPPFLAGQCGGTERFCSARTANVVVFRRGHKSPLGFWEEEKGDFPTYVIAKIRKKRQKNGEVQRNNCNFSPRKNLGLENFP